MDTVETAAMRVGLHVNAKKTKCMIFKQQEDVSMITTTGTILEVVKDLNISDPGCIAAPKTSIPGKHKHGEPAISSITWKSTLP